MPITTTFQNYDKAIKKVTKVRDFDEGEDAIKDKGEVYLSRLGGQTTEEYDAYKMRGFVIPAVSPTKTAITGAIMRKPPVVVVGGQLDYLAVNADGNNNSLSHVVSGCSNELLLAGAVGYLVEMVDGQAIIKQYAKESIRNMGENWVVLAQSYGVPNPKDKYEVIEKTEYLELGFDTDGDYVQVTHREANKGWSVVSMVKPDNRGVPLKEIPFVIAGELADDPYLLHLANVNCDQYRLATDLRHGLHFTALPTIFLFGELLDSDGKRTQIKVGAGSSNHIEDTDARAELLEFTGAGLAAIDTAISGDVSTMAAIGAKILTDSSAGVKAAETARIEASSETATLSMLANEIDNTFTQLLDIISEWMGATQEVEFSVNRDFIDIKLDSAQLMGYLKTMQSGGMSLHSFLSLLEKGELLPKGITAEDEARRIDTTGIDFDQ